MGKARNFIPSLKFGHKIYPEDLAGGMGLFGDTYYVDFANGANTNPGTTIEKPFKTLTAAHSAATTNNGDVIYVNGTTGTHVQEDTMLTWSKNRISVIGIGPSGAVDPQPEIQLSTAGNLLTDAATIKVTGYGNSFNNLYISNAGTGSTACVTALWDAGENNVYNNCQFAKFSDLNVAAVSHVEARGDTSTFRNCKFGVDWVTVSAARFGLHIKGTGGSARMKHNIFEDCYFVVASSSGDYEHIHVYDTNSLAFNNIWKNCVFMNALISSASAAIIDDAVNSVSGLVEGSLFFVNPATNSTSFCSTADQVIVYGPEKPVAATTGIGVTPS